ncbi:MAG: N-acetyl-gamma-glutamyl-phosphate reductase [Clostridiales bacterium]|jgi:N-acetyl-gamma-glutamyl-phosphate reductase common form|nr:N-acetyl-gamma-glutamyl-phosphate reductase [Clostridiales bacterium]
MIEVGIYGASGYMGSEALRILLRHPSVCVKWATSRSDVPIEYYHKNFYGRNIRFVKPDQATPCDVVFFALPTGLTAELCKSFYENGSKIIDFGADFRLKNQQEWEDVYGKKHPDWEMANQAVYGLTELHKDEIKRSKIIANPGCYSSSSILALAPLVKNALIDADKIIVDGLSGTVGAGDDLDLALHHPEIHNNLLPYNVVNHRHSYEIEQELSLLANKKVVINFSACYVPISRGVMTINHAFPLNSITRRDVLNLYQDFYKDEFFVKILDLPKDNNAAWNYLPYPWIAAVSATNFCHIGIDVDEKRNRIVIYSALDSIGKGGALVGVQNLNLMCGLDEKAGLDFYGIHPY